MRREPRTFSIWATVARMGPSHFEVNLSGLAVDADGPEERFAETAMAETLEAAIELRLTMVKEVCKRLEIAGSRVSMVQLHYLDLE